MRPASLSRIEAILRRHAPLFDVYIHDLRTGEAARLGTPRPYPIGSCFKLAVMVAVFETLSAEDLNRPVSIAPDDFSIGGGVLRHLDSPILLTPLQMIQLMLATSDATCADRLTARVGLDRVQAVLHRLAPQATVRFDLQGMMERCYAMPEAQARKDQSRREAALVAFTDRVADLGSIDARQLAELTLATVRFDPGPDKRSLYQRCLSVTGRSPLRTTMFTLASAPIFGKTGSLFWCFFATDTMVMFDRGEPIATVGFASAGWTLPNVVVDAIFGVIGLETLRALGLDPVPNENWSAQGEALLVGDL